MVFFVFLAFHLYRRFWAMGRVKKATDKPVFCKSETPFLTIQYNLIQQMLVEEYLIIIIIINNVNSHIITLLFT